MKEILYFFSENTNTFNLNKILVNTTKDFTYFLLAPAAYNISWAKIRRYFLRLYYEIDHQIYPFYKKHSRPKGYVSRNYQWYPQQLQKSFIKEKKLFISFRLVPQSTYENYLYTIVVTAFYENFFVFYCFWVCYSLINLDAFYAQLGVYSHFFGSMLVVIPCILFVHNWQFNRMHRHQLLKYIRSARFWNGLEFFCYILIGCILFLAANINQDKYFTAINFNGIGLPKQYLFQDPATPVMEGILNLHHDIVFILIVIIGLVLWLLFAIMYYFKSDFYKQALFFNRSAVYLDSIAHLAYLKAYHYNYSNENIKDRFFASFGFYFSFYPKFFQLKSKYRIKYPRHYPRWYHGSRLEIFWTSIPACILMSIALPSFALLYGMDDLSKPVITLKAVGNQWYWNYEYTDNITINKNREMTNYKNIVDSLITTVNLEKSYIAGYNALVVPNTVKTPSIFDFSKKCQYFMFLFGNQSKIATNLTILYDQWICYYATKMSLIELLIYLDLFTTLEFLFKQNTSNFLFNSNLFFLLHQTIKQHVTLDLYLPIMDYLDFINNDNKALFVNFLVFKNFSNYYYKSLIFAKSHIFNASLLNYSDFLAISEKHIQEKIINNLITLTNFSNNNSYNVPNQAQSTLLRFDSYMISDDELLEAKKLFRLLSVDNYVCLPIKTHIRILVTANDVLHSWAVPALGIKLDACPGRLNQTGLYIKREGDFYGQCSEICGVNHAFMPIHIHAVSLRDYLVFLQETYIQLYYNFDYEYLLKNYYLEKYRT